MPAGVSGFISLSAQAENFTMTEGHYFTSRGYTSQSVFSAKSVLSPGINPSSMDEIAAACEISADVGDLFHFTFRAGRQQILVRSASG